MSQKPRLSIPLVIFNVIFFLMCIGFLATILIIFSPLSNAEYFPKTSFYIHKYFWTIYSGPVILAVMCYFKKRVFKPSEFEMFDTNPVKFESQVTSQVEMYKHDD